MRIYNIDFLRGLAALMVMLLHASSCTLPWIKESPLHTIFGFGKYGVEIFFVISGYIIVHALYHSNYVIKNSFQFLAKRIVRINPPAYLLIIAFLSIEYLTWKISGNFLILSDPFDAKLMSANFLFLTNTLGTDIYIDTFWTLEIEFQFYLLAALIFPMFIHQSAVIRHLAWAGLSLLGFSNLPIVLLGYVGCFLIGISYFLLQFKFINKFYFILIGVVIASIFLFHGRYFELLFSGLSLFIIAVKTPIKSNVFQFLGKISYSLYIVHVFVFTYLDAILNKLGLAHLHETIPTKLFVIVIYAGIAIIISALFHRYLEKPFVNYSGKIRWK